MRAMARQIVRAVTLIVGMRPAPAGAEQSVPRTVSHRRMLALEPARS